MNKEFAAQCEEVARLIQPRSPQAWLAEYVAYWANELGIEISRQGLLPTRAETKKRLSALVVAADTFGHALDEPTLRLFLAHMYGSEFEKEVAELQQSLLSIRNRAYLASKSSFVLNEAGKTRRGRGRTPMPGVDKPEVFCALIVAEACNFTRGKYPGARNKSGAIAANALWVLSGGRPKMSWGNSLSGWRQYFEAAQRAKLEAQRAECLRILRALHARAKALEVEI